MEEFQTLPAVVIDNGSDTLKVGFAEDDKPRSVFPSVLGRVKHNDADSETAFFPSNSQCSSLNALWGCMERLDVEMPKELRRHVAQQLPQQTCFFGKEALARSTQVSPKRPVEHGIVCNWDDMEELWCHAFYEVLRVAPEERPVLMTEGPLCPKCNREKMTQICFEKFNTPAAYVAQQAVLALYSTGRVTGVTLDCGEGVTHCVPVLEGYSLPHSITRADMGGADVTHHLMRLMDDRGDPLSRAQASSIKQRLGFVAEDYREATGGSGESLAHQYALPDGKVITLGKERFLCVEPLFQPALVGCDMPGVSSMLYKSCMKNQVDCRGDLLSNIVVAGGSSLFPGFAERLKRELVTLVAPSHWKINIEVSKRFSSWIGGSLLSSLNTFQHMWMTKQEYDEVGPLLVHRKCFS